jgi:hypothetical protein
MDVKKACTAFLLLQAVDTLEQFGFIQLLPYFPKETLNL